MLGQRPLLLLAFLAATLWSVFCNAAPTDVVYVWRGDTRSPEQIQAAGGFGPKGAEDFGPNGYRRTKKVATTSTSTTGNPFDMNISLWQHVHGVDGHSKQDDGYVSTSIDPKVAESFAVGQLYNNAALKAVYVYKIRVAENMIDVAATLGKYYPAVYKNEKEFAVLGGIKWGQVVSSRKIKREDMGSISKVKETPNKKYNAKKFDKKTVVSGGAQYQLAGFPPTHRAWKEDPWKQYRPTCNIKRAIGGKISMPITNSVAVRLKSPATSSNTKLTLLQKAPAKQPSLPAAKQPPVKQPTVNQPTVKQPPVKQPFTKKLPVTQPPVKQPPAQQPPVQQPPVQQPPVQQPPVKQPTTGTPPIMPPVLSQVGAQGNQSCDATASNFQVAMEYMDSIQAQVWTGA